MEFRESSNEKRIKEKEQAAVATATVEAEPEVEVEPEVGPEAKPVTKAKPKSEPKPKATPKNTKAMKPLQLGGLVYYLTGGVEVFLALRLLAAILNPSGTVNSQGNGSLFIYNVADPLTRPFYDIFSATGGHEPGAGLILAAMIVYGLLGWGIARLLRSSQA